MALTLLSSGIIHSGKLQNSLSQQHPKFANTLHNSVLPSPPHRVSCREQGRALPSNLIQPQVSNPAPRAQQREDWGSNSSAVAQRSGDDRSSWQCRAPWKPAQIPPAPESWPYSGLYSQTLPWGSSTWFPPAWSRPEGWSRGHLYSSVSATCGSEIADLQQSHSAISSHSAFSENGVRPHLHSTLPLIWVSVSWGQNAFFSLSAQTQYFQFRLDHLSTAVIFKASKKDEEWLGVLLIWAILNWRGQTKVSLFILKAHIQIASIQHQIISQSVTPTEKQYPKENSYNNSM